MMYNLTIRQKNAVDMGLNEHLDILDLAILSFFNSVLSNNFYESVHHEGRPYYWVAHSRLLSENPFIKLEKNSLYKRLKTMCDLGLLILHPDAKKMGRSYYAVTQKFHVLMFHEGGVDDTYGFKSDGCVKKQLPTDLNQEGIGFKSGGGTDLNPMDNSTDNYITENNRNISENPSDFLTSVSSQEIEISKLKIEEENKTTNSLSPPSKKVAPKKVSPPRFDFEGKLRELGAEEKSLRDWMIVRKKKGAANTETAMDGFLREVTKSGKTVAEAVTIAAESEWKGFRADWAASLEPKNAQQPSAGHYTPPVRQQGVYVPSNRNNNGPRD